MTEKIFQKINSFIVKKACVCVLVFYINREQGHRTTAAQCYFLVCFLITVLLWDTLTVGQQEIQTHRMFLPTQLLDITAHWTTEALVHNTTVATHDVHLTSHRLNRWLIKTQEELLDVFMKRMKLTLVLAFQVTKDHFTSCSLGMCNSFNWALLTCTVMWCNYTANYAAEIPFVPHL